MKKEIAKFVYACLTCQDSKIEYQNSLGLMQLVSTPEGKRENISMDFVSRFSRNVKNYVTTWVIMDRLTEPTHLF